MLLTSHAGRSRIPAPRQRLLPTPDDARIAISHNTVANFMQAAALVIIPVAAEGTPYTLGEAPLHRKPVIANRSGNAIDYRPHEYLLETTEPKHIAERVSRALGNLAGLYPADCLAVA